ncbi:MAG: hypothetical protein KIT58_00855 [Planctomycetota bacterium]|nr:hypothetical protein [Planctomycetota bacterium]
MPKPWEMSPEELKAEADRLRPSWDSADEEDSHLFLLQISEDPDDVFLDEDEEIRDDDSARST